MVQCHLSDQGYILNIFLENANRFSKRISLVQICLFKFYFFKLAQVMKKLLLKITLHQIITFIQHFLELQVLMLCLCLLIQCLLFLTLLTRFQLSTIQFQWMITMLTILPKPNIIIKMQKAQNTICKLALIFITYYFRLYHIF